MSPESEQIKWRKLAFSVRKKHVAQLWEKLDDAGISGVLIKGVAAALNYPDPTERDPGDIDLMVATKDCQRVSSFQGLSELGVDVHCGPRSLDELDFESILENSVSIVLEGTEIRIPSPEDHLRIMCVHWLTDGGEKRDRLWDIYWAVNNRPPDFDWERCLDVVSSRRRRWVICTIGLAHKYLGLNVEDLPFAPEAMDIPDWLAKAIELRWEKGVTHVPIHHTLRDPKAFLKQLRKRFPPNPVMATISMEGDLDAPTRIHYQAGHVVRQATPSIKRIWKALTGRE